MQFEYGRGRSLRKAILVVSNTDYTSIGFLIEISVFLLVKVSKYFLGLMYSQKRVIGGHFLD